LRSASAKTKNNESGSTMLPQAISHAQGLPRNR